MKKNLLFVAASATLLFAACTSESGGPSSNISYDALKAAEKADVQTPITFGTFTPREAVTRVIGDEVQLANHYGFGVFAYYTENADYAVTAKPNFMFNQQVEAETTGVVPNATAVTGWKYSPIKYWPNNTQKDGENTTYNISDTKDKLSFFAYAPYIFPANIAADGTVMDNTVSPAVARTKGVIKVAPANGNIAGDVKLTYVGGSSKYSDELMFGVTQNNRIWNSVDGGSMTIDAGRPFKNLVKPVDNDRTITFYFMHALTKIGMTVRAAKNQALPGGDPELWNDGAADPNKTKILIEKIEFNRDMHWKGTLNLDNTSVDPGHPKWEDIFSENPFEITETGVGHADLDDDLTWEAAYATDPTEAWTKTGVVAGEEKSVFGQHGTPLRDDYLLLLPETTAPAGDTYITITYHVMTKDANLPNGVSDVKNVIKKKIPAILALEKGKSYEFNLILGVNTVDMDVDVKNWTTVPEDNTYLPMNKPGVPTP